MLSISTMSILQSSHSSCPCSRCSRIQSARVLTDNNIHSPIMRIVINMLPMPVLHLSRCLFPFFISSPLPSQIQTSLTWISRLAYVSSINLVLDVIRVTLALLNMFSMTILVYLHPPHSRSVSFILPVQGPRFCYFTMSLNPRLDLANIKKYPVPSRATLNCLPSNTKNMTVLKE